MNHETTPISSSNAAIKIVLTPKEKDLGGFTVKRSLPTRGCRSVGPWVFFDHIGPASFSPGDGVDVPPHPHIGLATVTYLFEGEMLHRDSLGNTARIVPGDINLMVSGKGITHSERQRLKQKQPTIMFMVYSYGSLCLKLKNKSTQSFIHMNNANCHSPKFRVSLFV